MILCILNISFSLLYMSFLSIQQMRLIHSLFAYILNFDLSLLISSLCYVLFNLIIGSLKENPFCLVIGRICFSLSFICLILMELLMNDRPCKKYVDDAESQRLNVGFKILNSLAMVQFFLYTQKYGKMEIYDQGQS